jgi:hypothetical protein
VDSSYTAVAALETVEAAEVVGTEPAVAPRAEVVESALEVVSTGPAVVLVVWATWSARKLVELGPFCCSRAT